MTRSSPRPSLLLHPQGVGVCARRRGSHQPPGQTASDLGHKEAADACDCSKDPWGLEPFLKLLFFPLLRRHSCSRKTRCAFGSGTRFSGGFCSSQESLVSLHSEQRAPFTTAGEIVPSGREEGGKAEPEVAARTGDGRGDAGSQVAEVPTGLTLHSRLPGCSARWPARRGFPLPTPSTLLSRGSPAQTHGRQPAGQPSPQEGCSGSGQEEPAQLSTPFQEPCRGSHGADSSAWGRRGQAVALTTCSCYESDSTRVHPDERRVWESV